jgi:hypothetical protein
LAAANNNPARAKAKRTENLMAGDELAGLDYLKLIITHEPAQAGRVSTLLRPETIWSLRVS